MHRQARALHMQPTLVILQSVHVILTVYHAIETPSSQLKFVMLGEKTVCFFCLIEVGFSNKKNKNKSGPQESSAAGVMQPCDQRSFLNTPPSLPENKKTKRQKNKKRKRKNININRNRNARDWPFLSSLEGVEGHWVL